MTTRRRKPFVAALIGVLTIVGPVGVVGFGFFCGGYHVELWLGRFDQTAWLQNKTVGRHSPRRPMAKAVMRRLTVGMTRPQVEALLGSADWERSGWHAYLLGYPRWAAFALDPDVFEVRYEQERLVEMRVRST